MNWTLAFAEGEHAEGNMSLQMQWIDEAAESDQRVREGDPRDFNDGLLLISTNVERRIHKREAGAINSGRAAR